MMGNVRAKKHLGQHFLRDKRIAASIVDSLKAEGCDTVMEVGPGTGVLTQLLINREFSSLKVVEIDPESVDYLLENMGNGCEIIKGDFLELDLHRAGRGRLAGRDGALAAGGEEGEGRRLRVEPQDEAAAVGPVEQKLLVRIEIGEGGEDIVAPRIRLGGLGGVGHRRGVEHRRQTQACEGKDGRQAAQCRAPPGHGVGQASPPVPAGGTPAPRVVPQM